jgi:phasin family protein
MTGKSKTKTAAKLTKALKAEVPAATVVAAKPAVAKKAPLVSHIVSVAEAPITQGTVKMTEAKKETTAETYTAKAKEIFADVQVRAAEAAEKAKKLAADAAEFNKANLEAMLEAGKIAAKGAQDMGKTNVEFAKSNFESVQAAVKEVTAVKSPTDFVKLQGDLARKGFDAAVAQGSKNTEFMVKLVSDMFQPISNRIAVTTELFKKAA